MRIAVIGGTGMAGRHTVEAVHRAGHAEARLAPTTFDAWLATQGRR
jgi:uncharacterized protein YbjT (DUF2867 family)